MVGLSRYLPINLPRPRFRGAGFFHSLDGLAWPQAACRGQRICRIVEHKPVQHVVGAHDRENGRHQHACDKPRDRSPAELLGHAVPRLDRRHLASLNWRGNIGRGLFFHQDLARRRVRLRPARLPGSSRCEGNFDPPTPAEHQIFVPDLREQNLNHI